MSNRGHERSACCPAYCNRQYFHQCSKFNVSIWNVDGNVLGVGLKQSTVILYLFVVIRFVGKCEQNHTNVI